MLLDLQFLILRRIHCALILRIHLPTNLIHKVDPNISKWSPNNTASYPTETECLVVLLWHCYLNSKLLLLCHFTYHR